MVHLAVRLIYDEGAREPEESVGLVEGLVHLKHVDVLVLRWELASLHTNTHLAKLQSARHEPARKRG